MKDVRLYAYEKERKLVDYLAVCFLNIKQYIDVTRIVWY